MLVSLQAEVHLVKMKEITISESKPSFILQSSLLACVQSSSGVSRANTDRVVRRGLDEPLHEHW